jgi:hypothetical protein
MATVSPADAWFIADCTALALQDAAVIVAAFTLAEALKRSATNSFPAM